MSDEIDPGGDRERELEELAGRVIAGLATVPVTDEQVVAERQRQIALGYGPAHDVIHGPAHLLVLARDYARRGEWVKVTALIEAAHAVVQQREQIAALLRAESEQYGAQLEEVGEELDRWEHVSLRLGREHAERLHDILEGERS